MLPFISDRRQDGRRIKIGRRRHYTRVFLDFEGFYESPERALIARGADLNLRGAFFRTPVPDLPGIEGLVRLVLPGSPTLVKVQSRVVHANDDPDEGPVGMGVRFVGLEPWQIKRIASNLLRAGGLQSLPVPWWLGA